MSQGNHTRPYAQFNALLSLNKAPLKKEPIFILHQNPLTEILESIIQAGILSLQTTHGALGVCSSCEMFAI